MDFNRYYTNQELAELLHQWAARYPQLCELRKLGTSYENQPIWLAVLTNQTTGGDLRKPALWLDGNLHATEIAGTTTLLSILHHLLEGYDSQPQITRILDQACIYAAPRLNPDGAGLAMASIPRYLRSGVRPYPYEDRADGLHAQDIDGDGRILQMRLPDPCGDWKVSSLDGRLMEKRRPDEHGGAYYRLLPEGLIENYDGHLIKIAPALEGLDFNRNFPFEWRTENDQKGAGPYPASEPEIRAVADFIAGHPNINLAVTYHTYSGVILRPYSTRPDDDMDADDLWVYKEIAQRGTELTGYPNASVYHEFRYHPKEVITGGFDDWMFDHWGAFSFTVELWDLVGRSGIKDRKFIDWLRDHPHEHDLKILQWIDAHGGEDTYIQWYPFEHPQLGDLELGGWNAMYSWRNPPSSLMGEEAARNTPYVLALADMLPNLQVRTLEVRRLEGGDYHLNLVVENTGYLPTYTSSQGKQCKFVRPVRVELDLPAGVELISGTWRTEIGHLEGRSNKRSLFTMGSSPTDNRSRVEWVLRGSSGTAIDVHVISARAGTFSHQIVLPSGPL